MHLTYALFVWELIGKSGHGPPKTPEEECSRWMHFYQADGTVVLFSK